MTAFLIRLLLPSGADPGDPQVRQRCGSVSGGVGIALNALLFLGKLLSGLATGSIAVVADAFNNLSDAASSVITLVGFRLAGQDADQEHPFGHGRMEYLTGLVVALAILLMGVEIGKSSLEKIFSPEVTTFSWMAVVILFLSILVKLWMFFFNRTLGRRIGSAAMEATAADSLSDSVSTGVVLLSTLISHFLHVQVDGFAGLLVAVFILKTGWDSARETLDPLLGKAPEPDVVKAIEDVILSHRQVVGIHDLVIHDYGPGRRMMSVHAEVAADADILEVHDVIDHIERELGRKFNIEAVIHMDPIQIGNPTVDRLRELTAKLAAEIDPSITIHDFRITAGPLHTNLIFDVVVPYDVKLSDEEVINRLKEKLRQQDETYTAVIQVDHSYVL